MKNNLNFNNNFAFTFNFFWFTIKGVNLLCKNV